MHIEKKTLRRIFLGVISCIIVYWLLHETQRVVGIFNTIMDMLSPFIIGASIAFVLNVPMRGYERLLKFIKKKTLKRMVAITLTMLSVFFVLTLVFLLLIPQIINAVSDLIPSLSLFIQKLEYKVKMLIQENRTLIQWGVDKANLADFNWSGVVEWLMGLLPTIVEDVFYGVVDLIVGIFNGLFDALIAVVFSVYCLFQKEKLARQSRKLLYAFLPEKVADKTIEIGRLSSETFANFLSGQCIEVCILGSLFAIAMTIFGMPYAPLISVLIALTAFIPVVGAWTGCIIGAFLIFVSNLNDPMQAVWFVVMFIIIQQLEDNLVYPRVVGSSIGLSGMWVLLAIGVGGSLLGIVGMFIMIPATSVIYTILRDVTHRRLSVRGIDEEKLREHPPAIRSKFKKKVKVVAKNIDEEIHE